RFHRPVKGGGPERFKKFRALIEKEGGQILAFHGLVGPYDVMVLADYPSIRAAAKGAAAVGNLITAESTTLPALEPDDFLQLLKELNEE
ncbi:MAG: hypothetical protein DMD82_16895, partial [Candidatus Rokuibacteriota bacterium]